MNPIMVIVIGILLFLLVCFIIRKKDIDIPGYDRIENGMFLILILGVCIMWPPIFANSDYNCHWIGYCRKV